MAHDPLRDTDPADSGALREAETIVAEEILGWVWLSVDRKPPRAAIYPPEKAAAMLASAPGSYRVGKRGDEARVINECPAPSVDAAGERDLLQALRRQGCRVAQDIPPLRPGLARAATDDPESWVSCTIAAPEGRFGASAPTAGGALVLAAAKLAGAIRARRDDPPSDGARDARTRPQTLEMVIYDDGTSSTTEYDRGDGGQLAYVGRAFHDEADTEARLRAWGYALVTDPDSRERSLKLRARLDGAPRRDTATTNEYERLLARRDMRANALDALDNAWEAATPGEWFWWMAEEPPFPIDVSGASARPYVADVPRMNDVIWIVGARRAWPVVSAELRRAWAREARSSSRRARAMFDRALERLGALFGRS